MPNTQHNGEFPLPPNWGMATDFDGKIYFIDHINKETTWLDPRDRITKPHTFADCVGDELPIGWEESHDPLIGRYYINHIDQTTQLEDPRKEWKTVQEAMLRDYLIAAQDNLEKKKEIFDVKQQRLLIAQDEYNKIANLATSRSSLYSSSSSISTRHDPDSIRAELVLAKERVRLLKQELSHITNDISLTQRGVDKLYSVEQKINSHHNGCYDISEVQAIRQEMLKVQKSLVSGEKVREELVQSLVQIKNELMRQQDDHHLNTSSAVTAAAVAAAYHDRVCVASQTDLYVDHMMNSGARYAEMAKTKLQYSEWRKRIKQLQQQIAEHVEKIEPNKLESDKDRLLLIQEKEKLLSELRSTSLKHKSPEEITELQQTCKKLEDELKKANQTTNQCLVNRLRLHEDKQLLLVKLQEALKSTKMLEDRLKSFSSESTFSISSGSSMGSLSTASSKSALSFTDIYLDPLTVDPAILDVNELHRCSQRLSSSHASASEISLSPRSSLSMETPPASPMKYSDTQGKEEPTYANAMNFALIQQHQQPSTSSLASSHSDWDCMRLEELKMIPSINLAGQLSPIFEKPTLLNLPQDMLSRSSSTSNTRSVSAAVSNESVAGDSGVFEASRAHLPRKELAQVQIGMKYIEKECILVVAVERASNLAALMPSPNSQIYLRAALLPNSLQSIRTKSVTDFQKPVFGDNFAIPISLDKILRKSLQITVVSAAGQREEIIGAVQISLAEFNAEDNTLKWYNILSSKFLPHETIEISGACKEESSDDSTIISSQTSTLTRNQGPSFDAQAQIAEELKEHLNFDNEEEEDDEEEEVDEMDPDNEAEEQMQNMLANYMNTVKQEYVEKETNTECAFPPEKSRLLYPQVQPSTSKDALNGVDDRPVKRSQTFSPSVEKGRYICRLNRSDSDSAMHFVPTPFQRGAVERRSLRFQTKVPKQHSTKLSHTHIPRTSLDLELDLQAQHSKLDNLYDEIHKLKNLKQTLKTGLDNKDPKIAMWARESEEFQRLVDRADSSKSPEEKQLQKLLHKTAKEVYKLRRTKIPKGSADLTSFKQKMLFFTSRKGGVSVPELPSELYVPEGIDEVEEENEDDEEVEEEQTTNISQLSSTVNNNGKHDGHLNLSTTELNLTNNHKSLELNTSPTLPANTCVPNRGPPPPYPIAVNAVNGGSSKFDYVIDRKYGVEV